ncbi:MAG: hypothetical protein ACKO1T_01935 [Sediminibacterium sp.]
MASLNGRKTNRNLLKKGFQESNKDHRFFEFWHKGVFITKTKTSHNDQDIYDPLIIAMSKQCKVSKDFFKKFATCEKSKDDYVKELEANKII